MNRGQQLPSIPCWALKHPKDALDILAKDEGTWSRGYAMNPVSPGELKFPNWEKCRKTGFTLAQLWERKLPAYIGVDLSSKSRPGNAIIAVGLEPPIMRRYVLEIRYGAWSSPDTAAALAEVCSHHNVQWIQVENNAYQQSIIDWVKREKADFPYWMKIMPFTTGAGKADPQYGLPGLEVEFKNDAWVVPYGEYESHPTTCICDWCHLDQEMRMYPRAATSDGVMACLVSGSMVTTSLGPVPIEDVRVGDLVLTHRSRWRRVTETFTRAVDGEVIELRVGGGMPIVLTPEHPVWMSEPRFNHEDRTNRLEPTTWDFKAAGGLRAGRKLAGDFVMLPVPGAWPVVDDGLPPWVTTADEGFLVGLYLAEGFLTGDPHAVSFALHEREGYIADFVERIGAALFGASTSRRCPKGRSLVATINSRRAVPFFRPFRSRAIKAMPWSWMALDPKLREAIVRGWFVGDGHLYSERLAGVSVSRGLIDQVTTTLRQLGMSPSVAIFETGGRLVQFPDRSSYVRRSWKVTLTRSDTARFLSTMNEVERERWPGRLPEVRERTNQSALEVGGGFATRLRVAERRSYSGLVHNLHVEEDESYTVEGIAVHNCWFARDAANKWVPRTGGPRVRGNIRRR